MLCACVYTHTHTRVMYKKHTSITHALDTLIPISSTVDGDNYLFFSVFILPSSPLPCLPLFSAPLPSPYRSLHTPSPYLPLIARLGTRDALVLCQRLFFFYLEFCCDSIFISFSGGTRINGNDDYRFVFDVYIGESYCALWTVEIFLFSCYWKAGISK